MSSIPARPGAAARPIAGPIAKASPTPAAPASHDPDTPAALVELMLRHWAPRGDVAGGPTANCVTYAARRQAVSAIFPGDVLVVPTGHDKVRSNDTYYPFRPSSDFYYLTGDTEPDCVLVLEPVRSGGHKSVLFVEPSTRGDAAFFTDRGKGELWVGPRLGVAASLARYGVDDCRALPELGAYLDAFTTAGGPAVRVVRGFSPDVDRRLPASDGDAEIGTALAEMRLIKDDLEVTELEGAIASTAHGFEDVVVALRGAKTEREVEATFNYRARVEGNAVGYGTIAAAGAHACTLHWTRNDGALRPGDLLLLDAGVEGNALYTADVTRTLPISGKFTPEQRQVYDLVYRAQRAAMEAVRPGVDFLEPNRVAMQILAEGLLELGVLGVSVEEAMREDRQLYRRYTLHNVSHMLGLDVHDCAQARKEAYKHGTLRIGMVLTIEPGLYFQPDDLTVPERLRGVGVRIEDDVLVTDGGHRNLSAALPRSADDVEAWMAEVWARPRTGR